MTLNVVDDFTRKALAIEVGRSIPGARIVRVLERLAKGLPRGIILDSSAECRALNQWAYRGVERCNGDHAGFRSSREKSQYLRSRRLSVPDGIACGSDCSNSFFPGSSVTVTAVPSPGMNFFGWSGACQGTDSACTLIMDKPKKVKAKFGP